MPYPCQDFNSSLEVTFIHTASSDNSGRLISESSKRNSSHVGMQYALEHFEGEDFVASVEYNLEDAVEDELMDFYFLFFILGH